MGNRPSFVIVNTDDMSEKLMKYLLPAGRHMVRDLGYRFVRYRDANVTTPWCCPSRSSLLTGLYTHQHGVHLNQDFPPGADNGGAPAFHSRGWNEKTFFRWLKDVGYFTGFVGRYMNGYAEVGGVPIPDLDQSIVIKTEGPYFDYTLNENGTDIAYGSAEEDYQTDVLRDHALDILRAAPDGKPFVLYFAPSAPHVPSVPAPRHANELENVKAPRTPAYAEPDASDKPQWVRDQDWPPEKEQAVDARFRDAARCVLSIGDALTAIADELETLGRDDVIFLVTDDNGYLFGDHRWESKKAPYQKSVRVLLAAASNNRSRIPANKSYPHLVSTNIDIASTLLDLAGATPTHAVEGTSLAPTFTSNDPIHDEIYYEMFNYVAEGTPERPIPSWRGIRTPNEKLLELFTGEREFYRLDVDPWELDNAIDDPTHALRIADLAQRLDVWQRTGDDSVLTSGGNGGPSPDGFGHRTS